MPQDVEPDGQYRVTRNLVFRSAAPARSDYASASSFGVIPADTIIPARRAPESPYARSNGRQYWLNVVSSDR